MGYTTANTEWTSIQPIPSATKAMIDLYFNLLDTNSPQVGDQLVSDIFTSNAVIYAGPGGTPVIRGSEAIRSMREGAWKVIQKRKHVVSRVYVFDAAANDLLLLGQVEQTLYNGKVYVGEWAARILVVYDTPGNEAPESEKRPKITYHKGWADFTGAKSAIQDLSG